MEIDKDALFGLAGNARKFEMRLGQKSYAVDDFSLSYSEIPVNSPTIRGGVYFSDKMGFKIKAHVSSEISGMLSKAMLGPNSDFEKIEFLTVMERGKTLKIFANLTNYVQRGSGLELNLLVVGTDLSG